MVPGARRLRLWPRSLATRTALVVIFGLVIVQCLGLLIHTLDRNQFVRTVEMRGFVVRVLNIYRDLTIIPAAQRQHRLEELPIPEKMRAWLADDPHADLRRFPPAPPPIRQSFMLNLASVPLPPPLMPHPILVGADLEHRRQLTALRFPDSTAWLMVESPLPRPDALSGPTFLIAFLIMTVVAALLTIWAVRRLTAPVRTLSQAADRLGRDVNAPPLPEDGPSEIAAAAIAFNLMASRIRRFVEDRTMMLTAIGHDLRTPITRMRLRAEFMEDEDQRAKMLRDLDEMEAMVSATLAFGRTASTKESRSPIDLAELILTVLDEAADANPDSAERLHYDGPDHLTAMLRPQSFKRLLTNLVSNAIKYGDAAEVRLLPPTAPGQPLKIEICDDGPGIPLEDMDRVFQPFQRLETSRNRETGGVGLGLTIARDIARAHGGELTLSNRMARHGDGTGACVSLVLPV